MLAPIVVLLYKRPQHAFRTLKALAGNYLAPDSDVFLYVNASNPASRDSKEKENVAETENIAKKFANRFKACQLKIRSTHFELNDSVCDAVGTVVKRYGRVIVLEDDVEVKKNFLDYMNAALDYYDNDKSVWNISGYCPLLLHNSGVDVFRACSFMPWGWGVWKDRWEKVDWERRKENLLRLDFSFLRNNMPLFDLAARRDILTGNRHMYWDYIYSLTQARLQMDTIFPTESLAYNFGNDGTGETELDGSRGAECVMGQALTSRRSFDFREYQLSEKEHEDFIERLYYRHKRSPMDKEAYNKRFWFYIWLRMKFHEANLAAYLMGRGTRKVAVYGMGYAGELLCEELEGTDIEVKYVMDRSGRSVVKRIPLLSLEDSLPEVDMVIVTVSRASSGIAKSLAARISHEIVSFEDLIFEWALHEKL